MGINQTHDRPTLRFFMELGDREDHKIIQLDGFLQPHQWYHFAAVTGPGGMKLYVNGAQVAHREYTGSFAAVANGDHNYLGRPNWTRNADLRGQMDEVRVWNEARRGDQIRAAMFRRLRGDEEGLVGLWNFDAGDARDSSPNGHHGKMAGDARCIERAFFREDTFVAPALLTGAVRALDNSPQHGIVVQAIEAQPPGAEGEIHTTLSDEGGHYLFANLRPGAYQVRCHKPGGHLYYDEGRHLQVSSRTPLAGVDFRLGTVKKGVWRTYTFRDGLAAEGIHAVHRDSRGLLWFGTETGVTRFDGEHFHTFTIHDGLAHNNVRAIHQDRQGHMWFATGSTSNKNYWSSTASQGVSRYDGEQFVHFTLRDRLTEKSVHSIAEDLEDHLWFATLEGVWRYDGHSFVNFTTLDGLASDRVIEVHATPDGLLWVATQNGVSVYDPRTATHYDRRDGLTSERVLGLHRRADGALWLEMETGVMRGDLATEAGPAGGHAAQFADFGRRAGLADHRVDEVYQMTPDILFFATRGAGVWRYDGRDFVLFTTEEGLPDNQIRDLYEDGDGDLWLATSAGISRYDGEQFHNLELPAEDGSSGKAVNVIRKGVDGALLFGTDDAGIWRYDGALTPLHDSRAGLEHNKVEDLRQTADGLLWVATRDGDLRLFDGTAWSTLDQSDGLPDDRIYGLVVDADGAWLATGKGLARYRRGQTPPKVRIETAQSDQLYTDPTHLPPVETSTRLSFQVSAVDFRTAPAKRQYRYRIAEVDSIWRAPTRLNRFEWVPESAGAYTFEVQAIDRDLNYSEPARLALQVILPWQRNPWIVLPLGSGAVGLLAFTFFSSLRLYRQRREAERLREELLVQERKAREAAEEASRAKTLFLANMSHEIRTPMNAILGYARIIADAPEFPQGLRRPIETIQNSGHHLLELINDVLDLSRIEAGRMEVHAADFDLRALIRDLAAIFQPRCARKELDWLVRGQSQDALWVHGDEAKISQVLMNLLSNAVKFTEEGGIILALEKSAEDHYLFAVEDTGQGFDAGQADKLFQPFQQGEAGLRAGGTGLGLAIAQRNLQLLDSRLEWTSTPGQGSRFSFALHLPAVPGKESIATDASAQPLRRVLAPGQHIKALVVDDIVENREVLQQLLEQWGVEVANAASGPQALEQMRHIQPAIVFMDIRMAGMDGIETAQKIWEEWGHHKVKIAAVSASVLQHQRQRYTDAGFDFVLNKPIDPQQVIDCLEQNLQVEFHATQSSPPATPAPTIAPIALPEDLSRRLREAAEYYNITDLAELVGEVRQLDEDGRQWADLLQKRVDQYDMDGVLAVLRDMGYGE